jgi:DNA-binding transcriptional regulator PaaX
MRRVEGDLLEAWILWFQQALRQVVAGFGLSEAEIAPALKRMTAPNALLKSAPEILTNATPR